MKEDSGHKDVNGNWIPETPQAKLRNKLSPFWVLSTVVSDESTLTSILSTEKGKALIKELTDKCNKNKPIILDLINQTEDKN